MLAHGVATGRGRGEEQLRRLGRRRWCSHGSNCFSWSEGDDEPADEGDEAGLDSEAAGADVAGIEMADERAILIGGHSLGRS